MLFYAFLLFIVLPVVELALLLKLGDLTNWKVPLLIVLVTGVAGTWISRRQGWKNYQHIQEELRQGRMPGDALLDAMLIFAGGLLLVAPGLLTDLAGIALLIPPVRRWYKKRLVAWFREKFSIRTLSAGGSVVDSYVIDRPDQNLETRDHRSDPHATNDEDVPRL